MRITLRDYEKSFVALLSSENSLHYSPLSIIESKWILLSLIRKNKLDAQRALTRFVAGLKTILEGGIELNPTDFTSPEIEGRADLLWGAGIDDYFDRMLVATAIIHGMTLITEDKEISALAKRVGVSIKDWSTLVQYIR